MALFFCSCCGGEREFDPVYVREYSSEKKDGRYKKIGKRCRSCDSIDQDEGE